MKKIIICMAALILSGMSFAQPDALNRLFDEYTGKDGFIAITLTGDMMKMAAAMQEYKRDTVLESELSEMRILVQEKSSGRESINFYDELYNRIDKSVYKELMRVKEADDDVTMLAKESNGIISEFILIVGGSDDNVVIHATGNILLRELGEMAGTYDFSGFEHLKSFKR
ncbi:MAG: DUF4252 domain-containing protein [Bacteroidales bacterium]|nr:DUF4252 domain-containing protein [Bacteroidales bacterium]